MTTPIDVILRFIKTGQGDDQAIKALKDLERGTDGAAKGIKSVDTQSRNASQSSQSLAKSWLKVAAGATAVIAVGKQVVDFQKENIRLAGIQEDAETQLAQTIKSTGAAAGLTATELKQMASGLQGVTKFGDEATIQGQSLLLTFTSIGKDVFPRATETMLDMSQALGQDMKSSAIQLGKALNDPINGVSALQRVGVSFTESQKEQITTLAESGRLMEAQNLILDELSKQFGGSAAAAAETYTGKVEQMGNAWGDLREQLGYGLRLTGEQVDGTKGLVENTTNYLAVLNRLRDEYHKGNITLVEYRATQAEVLLTGKEATEVLDEYAQAELAAEQAAQKLNTRVHDTHNLMQFQAPLLTDAAKAFLAQDHTLRNVNRRILELGGNLGPTTRELEEMAFASGDLAAFEDRLFDSTQNVTTAQGRWNEALANSSDRLAESNRLNAEAAAARAQVAAATGDLFTEFSQADGALGVFNETLAQINQGTGELTTNQGSLNSAMYAAADAAGADAAQLAILKVATGELSPVQAEAVIKSVALEQTLKNLGQAYADGDLTLQDYITAAQQAVTDINGMTVSFDEQTGAITTSNDAAADLIDTLDRLPTHHDFVIKIAQEGKIPTLPTGPGSGQASAFLAEGGPVPYGPPISGYGADNVMIAAQTGEYMLKRSAVNKLGLNRLNYMNNTGRLPGYADGGYIGSDNGGGSAAAASIVLQPVINVTGVVSRQQGIESGRNILDGLVDAARGRGVRI